MLKQEEIAILSEHIGSTASAAFALKNLLISKGVITEEEFKIASNKSASDAGAGIAELIREELEETK